MAAVQNIEYAVAEYQRPRQLHNARSELRGIADFDSKAGMDAFRECNAGSARAPNTDSGVKSSHARDSNRGYNTVEFHFRLIVLSVADKTGETRQCELTIRKSQEHKVFDAADLK
jgi:hypothetical protein